MTGPRHRVVTGATPVPTLGPSWEQLPPPAVVLRYYTPKPCSDVACYSIGGLSHGAGGGDSRGPQWKGFSHDCRSQSELVPQYRFLTLIMPAALRTPGAAVYTPPTGGMGGLDLVSHTTVA